jgi:hypothetical protein
LEIDRTKEEKMTQRSTFFRGFLGGTIAWVTAAQIIRAYTLPALLLQLMMWRGLQAVGGPTLANHLTIATQFVAAILHGAIVGVGYLLILRAFGGKLDAQRSRIALILLSAGYFFFVLFAFPMSDVL